MRVCPTFQRWNLSNQTVLLRIDGNVTLQNGNIVNDEKLRATLVTINLLLEKKAKIIIITHLGRPENHDPALSTLIIANWYRNEGYTGTFCADPHHMEHTIATMAPGSLCVLENIRFFPEERNDDHSFAQLLASWASYYIFDAFGAAHRRETSIALLPKHYDCAHKSIGCNVARELEGLEHLLRPKKPFLMIMGGAKIQTKLPLIKHLIDKIDMLMLLPPLSNAFMHAKGTDVGASPSYENYRSEVIEILEKADAHGVPVYMAKDVLIKQKTTEAMHVTRKIASNNEIISIGPETVEAWKPLIAQAGTIFFNGPMGFFDQPETMNQTKALLQSIAQSSAFTVVGGGDSIAAVYLYGLDRSINFLSTGGGATLSYLAGEPMPGLDSFISCHP